jgi:anti-anti-sigma factor
MSGGLEEVRVERPAPGTAVVAFAGEHDLATKDLVEALLESLVDENELVVADFSEAAFVDSATMRVLLNADMAARIRGRRFRLQLGTAAIVRTAFELSGLLLRIECAHSRADALQAEDHAAQKESPRRR